MHCQHCGAELSDKARYCPSCGNPVAGREASRRPPRERLRAMVGRSRRERMVTIAVVLAALVALASFLILDDDDAETSPLAQAADARCVDAKRSIAAIATQELRGNRPGARQRYAAGVLVAVVEWREALEGVGAQPDGSHVFARLDSTLRDLAMELGTLSRVTRQGSAEDVAEQARIADERTIEVEEAVADAGLEECAATSFASVAPESG